VREVIERCASIPMPPDPAPGRRDALELPGGVAGNVGRGEGVRRGVGFAVGYKNHGYSGGFDDSSEARVTLSTGADGPIAEVHSAAAEVGQGVHTILGQIARTVLGVERVILHASDTLVGSAGSTSASRQTVVSGGAVKAACEAVLEELFERARRDARLSASELGVEDGFVTADGERVAPVEEFLSEPIVCTRVWRHRQTSPLDERGQGDVHVGFLFGAQRALVEVDEDLGLVRVVQLATAQDIGLAINPQSVIGQIEGGSAQGLGLALMEEIRLVDGRIANASFTDYLLPTTLDMPRVEVELIEEPEPDTPFGVKGVGEPSNVVAPAAIAAALRDALGIELNRIPVRPDDLVRLREPRPMPPWPPFPEHPAREPAPASAGITRTGEPT
jgi:CO/xanthine dehydrogenase Mo-binding subunit